MPFLASMSILIDELFLFRYVCFFYTRSYYGLTALCSNKISFIIHYQLHLQLISDAVFKATRELYKTYKGLIQLHALNFRCVNVYDPEDIAVSKLKIIGIWN